MQESLRMLLVFVHKKELLQSGGRYRVTTQTLKKREMHALSPPSISSAYNSPNGIGTGAGANDSSGGQSQIAYAGNRKITSSAKRVRK